MGRQVTNSDSTFLSMDHCALDLSGPGEDPGTWPTHQLSGEFLDAEREDRYLRASFQDRLRQLQVIGVPAAIFFVLGVIIDYLILGPEQQNLPAILIIRCLVALAILGTVLAGERFTEKPRAFEWLVLSAMTAVAVSTCILVRLVGGNPLLYAQTGIILVLLFYIFVPIRWIFVLLVSIGLSISLAFKTVLHFRLPEDQLVQILFYLVLINILGAIFSRRQQVARRREYAGHLSESMIANALRREMATRESMEQALAENEMRFRSLVELAPDAIMVHRHGRILYINPEGVRLVGGQTPADIIGRSLFDYILSENLGLIAERMGGLERGGAALSPIEVQTRALDGKVIDCEVVSGPVMYSGEPAIQSIVRDITERKRMRGELIRLATTDSLTGIFNRRKFFEELEREWSRARRHTRPLSLIMFDVDYFKLVNDTHGHAVGDLVLKRLVEESRKSLRSEDIFCRLGGEEFGVILPEVTLDGARVLAERIRVDLEAMEVELSNGVVGCTVSLGVADCDLAGESMDRALKRVDDALYDAKKSGRNRVEVA